MTSFSLNTTWEFKLKQIVQLTAILHYTCAEQCSLTQYNFTVYVCIIFTRLSIINKFVCYFTAMH